MAVSIFHSIKSSQSLLRYSFAIARCTSYNYGCKATSKTGGHTVLIPKYSYRKTYATQPSIGEKQEPLVPTEDDDFRLIYEGPLSKKVKVLKIFSLSTATLSVICGPVIFLNSKTAFPMFAKLFLASTVITMGVTTTLLLHWLTRVYVHKMYFNAHTRTFVAETFNLIGRKKNQLFSVEDIVIPEVEAAFSTFEARGNKYFIHMDMKEAEQILKYVREYNFETL